jgi:ATP-dependent Lon protease
MPMKNPALVDYAPEERRYFKSASRNVRQRIACAEESVISSLTDSERPPPRFRLLMSAMDSVTKLRALRKLEMILRAGPYASDYQKTMTWIDGLCQIPFGSYRSLPVGPASPSKDIALFLTEMRATLNARVYGLTAAKEHVLRLIARWITNPNSKGLVLGLHGPMGTGKTSLGRAVCEVLKLPFAMIPLGGANDGAYLTGFHLTYETSTWGKVADALMRCKCMNPVMFFDELDKVSDCPRGQEVIHTLIHMTDPCQNQAFNDKYFADVELDVSRSLVIFSYNDETRVDAILRDRITRVQTVAYTQADKRAILRAHLLPDVLAEYAMTKADVFFPEAAESRMLALVEEDAGVRGLRRALVDVVGHLHLERLLLAEGTQAEQPTMRILPAHVDKHVSAGNRRTAGLSMMYT